MLYSAHDDQCGTYFHTGRNSKTMIECKNDIIDYMLQGVDEDDLDQWKANDPDDTLAHFGVTIVEHEDKLPE